MRTVLAACLLVWFSGSSFGQEEKPLCPTHIQSPGYPRIARVAHVEGKLVLSVTIDAGGDVTDVVVTNDGKSLELLKRDTIFNARTWRFTKPPLAPYKQTIVYEYEIDRALPLDDPRTSVTFDLPGRVTIVTSGVSIQTDRTTNKN
jgi:TonB family protein